MWLRALCVAALCAVGASCVTPSVPIPPPDTANMSFTVEPDGGAVRFLYAPDPSYGGAVVYIFNRDLGEGVITTANADGSVESPPFAAEINDQVVVSFEIDEQISSRCVIVGEGPLTECDL